MSHPVRDAAQRYAAAGWHTLRLHTLSKRPVNAGWQKSGHADHPDAFELGDNIGVGLGSVSGGLVDVDLDCLEAVAVAPAFLPATATFGRASRPRSHWLYQVSGDVPRRTAWTTAQVEFRGSGGQTVFPPSIRGRSDKDPIEYQPEQIDWYDKIPIARVDARELRAGVVRVAAASILRQGLPHMAGGVHHASLALAGLFRRSGWPLEHALGLVAVAWGDLGVRDEETVNTITRTYELDDGAAYTGLPTLAAVMGDVPTRELAKLLHDDALGYTPPSVEILRDEPPFNDAGNASRFVQRYGQDLRFAQGVGWLRWTGASWAVDEAGPWPEAEAVAEELRTSTAEGDAGKALRKHGLKLGNAGPLAAMIQLASKRAEVRVEADKLDADPWLLGTPGGTLDLRTGALRQAAREDLITRLAAVTPDDRPCERFDRFLLEVMGGDRELAAYLLRFAGWALTGDCSEHAFALWHGAQGRNGKSTLVETMLSIWGDYGTTIATEVLLAAKGERHPTGLMDLRGRRLAVAHELPTGKSWDEALVKRLTGDDRVKARGMHKDFVEWRPQHHLIMTCNARPIVRDNSPPFWKRVHLVPWEISFYGREDPRLLEELRAEAPGILSRCVQGCGQWLAQGRKLRPAPAMSAAVEEYRESMDSLGQFLESELELGEGLTVPKTRVYEAYRHWSEYVAGEAHTAPALVFYRLLTERCPTIREAKRQGTRVFRGCQLSLKKPLAVVQPAG